MNSFLTLIFGVVLFEGVVIVMPAPLEEDLGLDYTIAFAGDLVDIDTNEEFDHSESMFFEDYGVLTQYDIMRPYPHKTSRKKRSTYSIRRKRSALKDNSKYWPNGEIPYVITDVFNSAEKTVIEDSIDEFKKYTCLKFVPRMSQANYLELIKQGGCWSELGVSGSKQPLSLSEGCVAKDVVVHEFMHAAGIDHHHSRLDRDNHVTINFNNIESGGEDQFSKTEGSTTFNIPYDYLSVMHYGRYAFSKAYGSLDTITTKDSNFQTRIGKAPTMSFKDIQMITLMYKCNQHCTPQTCPNDSFLGHDCKCYCDSNNPSTPISICGNSCTTPHQACDCSSDSCKDIPNTVCNSDSKACECNSDALLVGGKCQNKTSITCTNLNKDCQCSVENAGNCGTLPNSECVSNKCVCKTGFKDVKGSCVDINSESCDSLNKLCYCSSKDSGCTSLSHSVCRSDKCVCKSSYYNDNGQCKATPACTSLNTQCHCNVQGADACNNVANSKCDKSTGQCKCIPGYIEEGGACVSSVAYVIDGNSLEPFTNIPDDEVDWVTIASVDGNLTYIMANGSQDSIGNATLQSPELAAGTWCLKYGIDMSNAVFDLETPDEIAGFDMENSMGYFYDDMYKFNITSTSPMYIVAYALYEGDWYVKLRNVQLYMC